MYSNCIGGTLGNIAGALILVFAFSDSQYSHFKFYWLVAMFTLSFFRLADAGYWYVRLRHLPFDGSLASLRFSAGAVLSAAMWGVYGFVMFEHMELLEFSVLFFIISSLAGGAATVLAANASAATIYVAVITLPLSLYSLTSEQDFHKIYGGLGLILGFLLLFSARRAAGYTKKTIELKNEHERLLEKMQTEQDELHDLNTQLKEANTKLNYVQGTLESEVSRRTQQLEILSDLDPLTRIYNRTAFTRQLSELVNKSAERGFSLALLFIDLNGFKKINDTLGHKVGDAVLVEIASRLEAFANDYHAGRWGGDEFLIALPYADESTAVSVANALQTRIAQPLDVLSNRLNLTASVGIAMYPKHSESVPELIQYADFAMFEQKKALNPAPRLFDQDLVNELKHAQSLRDGLQEAIAKKELYLCYQPIVCSKGKHAISCEALLRWDFDGQFISPAVFIPLAEQSGLIKEIGSWVLHRACIDASQWQERNPASVSVNVSVMQLLDDAFLVDLDKALQTSGLSPQKLHLEITESMFADNKAKVVAQLDKIKSRGVQVSIDDFGTGYSSLSQLQNMRFDTIKIDRSFVNNIDGGGEAIIRATIFIASEFGCDIVAEGIETPEQAEALLGMGVNYLQGFMFSKPVRKEELYAFLDATPNEEQPQAEASK